MISGTNQNTAPHQDHLFEKICLSVSSVIFGALSIASFFYLKHRYQTYHKVVHSHHFYVVTIPLGSLSLISTLSVIFLHLKNTDPKEPESLNDFTLLKVQDVRQSKHYSEPASESGMDKEIEVVGGELFLELFKAKHCVLTYEKTTHLIDRKGLQAVRKGLEKQIDRPEYNTFFEQETLDPCAAICTREEILDHVFHPWRATNPLFAFFFNEHRISIEPLFTYLLALPREHFDWLHQEEAPLLKLLSSQVGSEFKKLQEQKIPFSPDQLLLFDAKCENWELLTLHLSMFPTSLKAYQTIASTLKLPLESACCETLFDYTQNFIEEFDFDLYLLHAAESGQYKLARKLAKKTACLNVLFFNEKTCLSLLDLVLQNASLPLSPEDEKQRAHFEKSLKQYHAKTGKELLTSYQPLDSLEDPVLKHLDQYIQKHHLHPLYPIIIESFIGKTFLCRQTPLQALLFGVLNQKTDVEQFKTFKEYTQNNKANTLLLEELGRALTASKLNPALNKAIQEIVPQLIAIGFFQKQHFKELIELLCLHSQFVLVETLDGVNLCANTPFVIQYQDPHVYYLCTLKDLIEKKSEEQSRSLTSEQQEALNHLQHFLQSYAYSSELKNTAEYQEVIEQLKQANPLAQIRYFNEVII